MSIWLFVGIAYVIGGLCHLGFFTLRCRKLEVPLHLRECLQGPVFLVMMILAWPVAAVWWGRRIFARPSREELLQRVAILEDRLAAACRETAASVERATLLEMALEHEVGPYCSSCGNAIDPDCCWCGTAMEQHRREEHAFVPMGCDCGRDPRDVGCRKIISNLRALLWRAQRDLVGLDEALAAACAVQVDLALELQGLEALSSDVSEERRS